MSARALADLQGLITDEVGEALRELARDVPAEQAIVEIGSFKGKSTCHLAAGAEEGEGAHVWAVDPWDLRGNVTGRFGFARPETREAFDRQVREAGLEDRITAVRAFSEDAAARWREIGGGRRVGLLYVDGDHSRQAVLGDFRAWRRRLADGARVAFDDLDTPRNPGVREALTELHQRDELRTVKVAGRLGLGRYPA